MSLAQRLISLHDKTSSTTQPKAIFGSVGSMAQSLLKRSPIRIGMWPCIADSNQAEVAGIWAILAYNLEKWLDIRIYRLIARTDIDGIENTDWMSNVNLAALQFSVDDFHLEQLDENAALWGVYTITDDHHRMEVFLENDLKESDEPNKFIIEGKDFVEIVSKTDRLSAKIAQSLDAGRLDESLVPMDQVMANTDKISESSLIPFLKHLADWELHLYLFIADNDWADDAIQSKVKALLEAANFSDDQFSAWCVGNAYKSSLVPGLSLIGELLADSLDDVPTYLLEKAGFVVPVSGGLYDLGYAEKAYEILETLVDKDREAINGWLKLADLYGRTGRIGDAIDVFQDAIKDSITSASLFRGYGMALLAADQLDLELEEFVLLETNNMVVSATILEAIQAFERTLEQRPDDVSALHRLLLQVISIDNERFWEGYVQLARLDHDGYRLRDITEALYELEDPAPAIKILENAIEAHPSRFDLYASLVVVLNLLEDFDLADEKLNMMESLVISVEQRQDLAQLRLSTQFPDFEREFGDIIAILAAGNKPSSGEIEFLEEVIEIAPDWADGYIALARSYLIWGDNDEGLEVLLDAQKQLPHDPNIAELLGKILWDAGEKDLAFEYLNKGLANDPNHLPLLVRIGWILFDAGQYADARAYIARAEMLDPRDSELSKLKVYIANHFSEQPGLAKRFEE